MSSMLQAKRNFDIQARLSFLGIDSETREILRKFKKTVEQHIDEILNDFYTHVASVAKLKGLVGSETNIARLKLAQKKHWTTLFSANFDEHYFESVSGIGQAHVRIGLEPRWYMGGYSMVLTRLIQLASKSSLFNPSQMTKVTTALSKAVFLDMDLSISVYFDTIIQFSALTVSQSASNLSESSADLSESADKMTTLIAKTVLMTNELVETITSFTHHVEETATNVEAIAQDNTLIGQNISQVGTAADEVSASMQTVASAAEEMSASVSTVAAAIEEMSGSLREVSMGAIKAAEVTAKADQKAESTKVIVDTLGNSAKEIDKVVELIKNIAAQTNLLALNATIEAASAGEAGKGFAVVANEVKELAKQAAQATEDIRTKIEAMQSNTNEAVKAIAEISSVIEEISDINNTIASAVEEQTVTANEISRSVVGSAQASQDVTENVHRVAGIAETVASLVHESKLKVEHAVESTNRTNQAAQAMRSGSSLVSERAGIMASNLRDTSDAVVTTAQAADKVKKATQELEALSKELDTLVQAFRS